MQGMKIDFTKLAALCIAMCGVWTTHLEAQTVRIHGGVTLCKFVTEQKAALESQTGLKLEVVGNGSGRGLADLVGGQADIAVIAGSVKGVAAVLNEEKAGSVDAATLNGTLINRVKLEIVVNSGVGVKSLTEAQARDIFTGKIANWKEVGGADVPVKVVLPFAGDGARVLIQEDLLQGAEFAKNPIVRNSSKDIPAVISQLPGAVSFLSTKNMENLTTVACDKDLQMPNLLVTKGEPAGDAKKVIEAIKAVIK